MHISIHDLTRRSTFIRRDSYSDIDISIHDLTRRSTFRNLRKGRCRPISIHDLTRRSTVGQIRMCQFGLYFNSRPHKEVDKIPARNIREAIKFQFTTSQGGRLKILIHINPLTYFNSRPHKEVDIYSVCTGRFMDISIHDLTRRSTQFGTEFIRI